MLPPPPPLQQLPDAPVLGGVYQGLVSGLMDFGCFVEIQGFRRKVGPEEGEGGEEGEEGAIKAMQLGVKGTSNLKAGYM